MTQREFWAEIEARTSKEVADYGFSGIIETDLPGVTGDEQTQLECANMDAAARAAQQAYESWQAVLTEEQRYREMEPMPEAVDAGDVSQYITPLE